MAGLANLELLANSLIMYVTNNINTCYLPL
jgi:hypothetical protein